MAFTAYWYRKALANLLSGETAGEDRRVDYLSDAIKIMITTNGYVPNLDTHEFKSDLANEVSGTGYSAGGATLGSKTLTYTAANAWGTQWAGTTAYAVGDVVRPTAANGHVYRCIVAGTSGASQPTWPTVSGQTVSDNTVIWAELGAGLLALDAADPSWPVSTITGRYAQIYDDTPSGDSNKPLLGFIDFGQDHSSNSGTFQITFHPIGFLAAGMP